MALLSSVDESTFTELSKRFHQKLKQQHALTLTLGQFRELMVQAVGHRSLHDARQVWRRQQTVPDCLGQPVGADVLEERIEKARESSIQLTEKLRQMSASPAIYLEQGSLLFWEEIGIPEPGTRDNPHPPLPETQDVSEQE